MQLSRFATNIKIDEDDYMLYSLKTRQYYPYKKEAQEQLEKLLDELNKGEYTLEEIQCIEKLMKKADIESKVYSQYDEQFQGLAWIALLLLIVDMFIVDRKNSWLKKITFFS